MKPLATLALALLLPFVVSSAVLRDDDVTLVDTGFERAGDDPSEDAKLLTVWNLRVKGD